MTIRNTRFNLFQRIRPPKACRLQKGQPYSVEGRIKNIINNKVNQICTVEWDDGFISLEVVSDGFMNSSGQFVWDWRLSKDSPVMNIHDELVSRILDTLNRAFRKDPEAMRDLLESRVKCNIPLANDNSIQVLEVGADDYRVGLMGILNGIIGTDGKGQGFICSVINDDGKLMGFRKIGEL